jgi:OMF family outer membrane factor
MKKEILTIAAIIVIASSVFSQKAMSRNEMIEYAFKNSENLAQLEADREKIVYMRKEYYGKALPDVSGAINYILAPYVNDKKNASLSFFDMMKGVQASYGLEDPNPYENFLAQSLDGAMGGMDKLGAMMSAKNTLQWEVKATQLIFAQGKVKTGLKMADISLEMLDERYKDAQFSLYLNITNAYNAALLTQQNTVIQQDALIIAEESYRIAKALFATGKGRALDTLNARYGHQEAVWRLRDAQKNQKIAFKALANAASMYDEDFTLSDSSFVQQFNMTEEEAWGKMLENNSSLKLLSKVKILQEQQMHLLKTDYLPIIAAFASIGQNNLFNTGKEFSDSENWNWSTKIGLSLQIPIFNGGQRKNKLNQAKLDEVIIDKQEIEAKNKLRLALSVMFEDLAVVREEFIQVEQMVALAEQGFKVSKLAFELGQITQLELNDNEQKYRGAKVLLIAAVFKINLAILNIQSLTGNVNLISLVN